jgi:hypothetical protein
MRDKLPVRFWVEGAIAAVSAAMLALTLVSPQWLELYFGLSADHGDGSDEWGLTLFLLALTLALSWKARRTWSRTVVA